MAFKKYINISEVSELTGENREVGKVLDSRRYVNLLKRRLAARPEGEPVYITIE